MLIKKYIKTTGLTLIIIILAIIFFTTFLSVLDNLSFIPKDSLFYGIDFLPAIWIVSISITPLLALYFLGYKKAAIYSLLIIVFYFLAFGDFSLAKLRSKTIDKKNYEKISVVALNVQYYTQGIDKVVDTLKSINADCSIISENTLTEQEERKVRDKLAPMNFFAGHANSTGIISKYPIISVKEIELPSHEASLSSGNDILEIEKNPHRSFVHAVISINGTLCNVISIRFIAGRPKDKTLKENVKWAKYLLSTQLNEVSFFKNYISKLKGPIIFGGDLNAPAGSKVIRELNHIAKDAILETNFWGTPTFRTTFPTLRIDYIYSMNGVIPIRAEKLPIIVSDHFPIYSELYVPKNISQVF